MSNIASLRKKQGLTQLQLAYLIGVDLSTVRNWERGRTSMDWVRTVIKLCRILECRPEDLIEEQEV